MKVLLVVSGYESAFPYIQNTEKELRKSGLEVDVLDLSKFWIKSEDGNKKYFPSFLQRFVNVRLLGTALILASLKWLRLRLKLNYDAVSIHSCDRIYLFAIKYLVGISPNISGVVWGSDFYRISNSEKEQMRFFYDRIRYIVFGNPQNANDFYNYYQAYRDKSLVVGYGMSMFDIMDHVTAQKDEVALKMELGIPDDGRKLVAIGYNGREMQQHALIINQLGKLEPRLKKKFVVIIQASYSSNAEYIGQLEALLKANQLDAIILRKFLSDEELAGLRLVTDIVLNAQISDGFSGSLQEGIYAGKIVISGDWLPYGFLKNEGITIFQCSKESFGSQLEIVLKQYDYHMNQLGNNKKNIKRLSGWETKITKWKKVFSGAADELKIDAIQ